MIDYICFGIGLLLLAGTIYRVYRTKNNFSTCVSNLSFGVLLMSMVFLFPTHLKDYDFGGSIVSAIQSGFYVLSGRQSVKQLYLIELDAVSYIIYLAVNYILFATAPVCLSALVVSQFGDTSDRIRRWLIRAKECHIFSELNEQSLALAKSLSEKDGKKVLIFCNSKDAPKSLRSQVRNFGGVLLYATADALGFTKRYAHVRFYQMATSEDQNVQKASVLLQWQEDLQKKEVGNEKKNTRCVEIFAFIGTKSKALIVEDIPHKYVKLRIIDEISLLCNNLFMERPLYTGLGEKKKISVMIVGCGKTGMQMIKTAVWCGQLENYALEINVFDKNVDPITRKNMAREELFAACPELNLPEYNIRFYNSDATCHEFESMVVQNCADTTYVVLAMKDDDLNIETAIRLRGLFLRSDEVCHATPVINARVRNDVKLKNLSSNSAYLQKRQIFTFGSVEELFDIDVLMNSELERIAFMVHLHYYGVLHLEENHEDYVGAVAALEAKEYNRNSSMANALHIQYKLFDCGLLSAEQQELTDDLAAEFQRYIAQPEVLERVAKLEHRRWNAFTRSLGYSTVSMATVKKYYDVNDKKSYINELAMLHPCLVPWDALDGLSRFMNEIYKTNPDFSQEDFQEDDRRVVQAIPNIISRVNQKAKPVS